MDKVVASPAAAVADIGDGASIGIAGFGVAHRPAGPASRRSTRPPRLRPSPGDTGSVASVKARGRISATPHP